MVESRNDGSKKALLKGAGRGMSKPQFLSEKRHQIMHSVLLFHKRLTELHLNPVLIPEN